MHMLRTGTGKSKTGARIAYLLASRCREKVLCCGPTNTAVDTVASMFVVYCMKISSFVAVFLCTCRCAS